MKANQLIIRIWILFREKLYFITVLYLHVIEEGQLLYAFVINIKRKEKEENLKTMRNLNIRMGHDHDNEHSHNRGTRATSFAAEIELPHLAPNNWNTSQFWDKKVDHILYESTSCLFAIYTLISKSTSCSTFPKITPTK